jgi:hypothetical protein
MLLKPFKYEISLSHSKELLKLYTKLYYRFVISCFVLEIFRPKLMSCLSHLGLILDLINYGFDDVRSWVNHIKLL